MKRPALIAAALFICALPGNALADKIGVTVAAADTVRQFSGGSVSVVAANSVILQDDRLKSNASGNAQIQLVDGTRVVVGPNADVRIDDFVYEGGATVKKLTLSATRGAFRFISGRSQHTAYKIDTPQATIGVRGTAFDVTVSGGRTYVALLNGALRVCARSGECRDIKETCQFFSVSGNKVGEEKPLKDKAAVAEVNRIFPLIANQRPLRAQFVQFPRGCEIGGTNPFTPQFANVNVPASPFSPPTVDPTTTGSVGNPGNDKGVGGAGESPNGKDYGGGSDGMGDAPGGGNGGNNGNGGNR